MFELLVISVFAGIGTFWVFGITTNHDAVSQAKRRMQAHLYELRLFSDDPLLILKAQRGLWAANLRYLALMLVPFLVTLVPMVLLLGQLECVYGHRPLLPGSSAVV